MPSYPNKYTERTRQSHLLCMQIHSCKDQDSPLQCAMKMYCVRHLRDFCADFSRLIFNSYGFGFKGRFFHDTDNMPVDFHCGISNRLNFRYYCFCHSFNRSNSFSCSHRLWHWHLYHRILSRKLSFIFTHGVNRLDWLSYNMRLHQNIIKTRKHAKHNVHKSKLLTCLQILGFKCYSTWNYSELHVKLTLKSLTYDI